MKYGRLIVFVLVALAQLAAPGSLIWKREHTLQQGHVWKFRTAPVDPVDAFRGRYVALRFDAETQEISPPENASSGDTVYATLKQNAEGFAEIDQVFATKPGGDNFMEAQLSGKTIAMPFDKYWVTERDAPAAETAYRNLSRRGNQNAYVTVRIFRGDAAIEQLYLDNQPLGDYLRGNATK
ncbi:MAG TPA: GDYXXLXY domain-containing protein [Chthoniobacterales bacterium]|nr:GDYXXLXY domain-containing protein [Chthoniobacterales bacterium]